jgi:aminopeptidase N
MDYLIWEDEEAFSLLWQQMESAKDMSDRCHAFKLLCRLDNPYREKAIDLYKKLHQGDNLTWPKWISVQAASLAEDTLERVRKMAQDESVCNKKVPNQIRALVAQFTNNPGFFHKVDGSGYAWVMEMLEEIDTFNPQTAAKLAKAFAIAPRLPQSYQTTMLRYIQQTLGKPLSVSLKEVLKHSLGKHQK